MLVIFVCGLMLLAALIFAAGLLVGRDWGASEAIERAKAAERATSVPAPAPATAPDPAPPAAAPGANTAAGAIRPAGAPPATPPVPAVPAIPAPPKAPELPAAPKAPSVPKLPPLKSSSANPEPDSLPVQAANDETKSQTARNKVESAPAFVERAESGEVRVRGYVVYVAAYVSGARAEKLAEQLRGRNLAAQTSVVDKPGQKPLVSVWVGPYVAKAEAQAAVPELRAAGFEDAMIKAVP
jgi:hypothetical protein